MSDDFLEQARRNWQAQDAEVESVGLRLKRGRRIQRALIWIEAVLTVLVVLFGAWFVWQGVRLPNATMLIAGVVVLLFAPPLCWLAIKARRGEPRWAEENPESILRGMIAHAEMVRKLMGLVRWQGVMMLLLTALLWGATPFGWVPVIPQLWLVSAVFLVTSVGCFAWARWRDRGAARERERCERLLAEFR